MKTYNKKAKCKKCNSKRINSYYKPKYTRLMEGFEDDPLGISYTDTKESTIIIRKCVRCSYTWYEKPLDTMPKEIAVESKLKEIGEKKELTDKEKLLNVFDDIGRKRYLEVYNNRKAGIFLVDGDFLFNEYGEYEKTEQERNFFMKG